MAMLADTEIQAAIRDRDLDIDPFIDDSLEAASYDFGVGDEAFVSGSEEKINVANKGLVILDPGEFAVLTTRERVHCGPRVAAQIGLCSTFARDGLVLLSGPQIDPGFDGVLVIRVTNLAPKRITLPHQAKFLTVQFFKLNHPVSHPYDGPRQGQTGLGTDDLRELAHPDSPTLGGMVRSLSALARDVSDLKTSVKWMGWAIPIIVGLGITVIGIIVALK
jgi:deoxycytidine triphosphate deaminase